MIRKLFLILAMLLAIPAFANAWYVNSKTSPLTGQGTISPAGTQTYAAGSDSGEYTVSPATGYKISRVTLDGLAISANANGKYVAPYDPAKTTRYIVAYFTASTVSITTSVTGSGAIREDTNESLTNIPVGSNRQLLVQPNPGYMISALTAPGATSITTNTDGSKIVIFNNLQANQSVSATFSPAAMVTANAGADVTANGAGAEYATTLYGSATSNQGSISYAWTGTGLSFGTPNAAVTTVFAAIPGTYTATLTVTSGGIVRQDSAIVTVFDHTQYLENLCTGCHSLNTPQVVSAYDDSDHKANHISCQSCHTDTPHNDLQPACAACHTPGNSYGLPWPPAGLSFHTAYSTTNQCMGCHDVHNPGIITGMPYPHFSSFSTAQYVTTNITCDNCHASKTDSDFHIYPANGEWAQSGKANPKSPSWTAYDFKTRGTPGPATPANSTGDDCVRCHTTTGYINFMTSGYTDIKPWGTSGLAPGGDRTREMIACNACHNTPFDADYSTRGFVRDQFGDVATWGPLPPPSGYYNYSSPATGKILIKRDLPQSLGKSNICVACHTGRAAGVTIKAAALATPGGQGTGAFWQNVTFINPHYMGAAGVMYRLTGYTYRTGASDYSNPGAYNHNGIGDGETGNCIICHMSSPEKHSYSPVTKDANGVINAITSARCNDCHAGGLHPIPDGAALEAFRQGYEASLQAVAELLAAKGIYFNRDAYPYFFTAPNPSQQSFATRTVNWDAGAPTFKGADMMGAAFNLKLLQADAGSWAHNSFYTKRLLYDTVDFLDDGNPNNSSVQTTIQNMPLTATFTQDLKDKALQYIGVRP
ncbi:cytochrome c3 family protein [Geobacter sp. SVR]|uniref:cytochrome c3 family protein n=1 Tax=Geobacter sp. SVR TaxID=2495594 RepID=UPI00143EFBE7|nr:cytochrome c3 family protein [Geobacter sp. SVR]BCS53263.1 hypothetical protein GSVR_15710 [Geobacter sp. SVR]GCF84649.1 hypothetical protein GSbR_12490 [Geobacter sp. SVR]